MNSKDFVKKYRKSDIEFKIIDNEEDSDKRDFKEQYLYEYDLLVEFAIATFVKDGVSPSVIGDFLDKKYFKPPCRI